MLFPIDFRQSVVVTLCAAWMALCIPELLNAQEPAGKNWRIERQSIERLFADDVQELANELRGERNPAGANTVMELYQKRDLQRQYVFVPTEGIIAEPANDLQARIKEIKASHAQRVFELAKSAAENRSDADAFQLLHEVIHLDPSHKEARTALAHKFNEDDGWQVTSDRIRVAKATKKQETMGWKKLTYLRVSTPHFNIDSIADEEATIELAQKLERWHEIWRQVFFEYWSPDGSVQRWLEGRGKMPKSSKKYQVIFFASKESYASQLEPRFKGIGVSKGYYSDQLESSFFYAGEGTTARHELTHQLFQESMRAADTPFQDHYLWLGEGIAMYFESLVDHGDYVTLGGFDSTRLQFSRIRIFRERLYFDLGEISDMSADEFQTHEKVRRLYSQSAGMCHMLMNGNNGNHQQALIEFIKLVYRGKLKAGSFQEIVGLNDSEFRTSYEDFLRTDNTTIENYLIAPDERTDFSLGNSNLSQAAFEQIGKCDQLVLLDLSENPITADKLSALSGCQNLSQLFLSNCSIKDNALAKLSKLKALRELDLTASSCTDTQFLELARCSGLAMVTVTGTNISNGAISQLKQELPSVEIQK